MRILLTVTGAWGTGSFQVAKGVADSLLSFGHEVKMFFPDSGLESGDREFFYNNPDLYEIWQFPIEQDGIRLENFPLMLPDPNPRNTSGVTLKKLSEKEREVYFHGIRAQLEKLIHRFQPDVIECQHIWAMDRVVSQMGLPFIAVAHNSDQIAFEYDPGMQPITKHSAKQANYLFAVSPIVKEKVVDFYGVNPEKVIVMPCGYETDIFYQQTLDREKVLRDFELDIPSGANLIVFAGKLSKTKGADILLQANTLLDQDLNAHIIMMGAGDLSGLFSEEEQQAINLDRIHFVGHRQLFEVAILNNIADLAVIPSRSEGFCIAGLEAIACGAPLIVTEGAYAASYFVVDVVPDENPKQLAQAIEKFFALPERERQLLSQKGLKSAQDFTWEAIVKNRLLYYEQALIKKDLLDAR